MLNLRFGAQFKRDRRLCIKRGYDMGLLSVVVDTLRIPAALPAQNRAHGLSGNWAGYIVRIHFSETSTETMEDKIKRMLKNEVRQLMENE